MNEAGVTESVDVAASKAAAPWEREGSNPSTRTYRVEGLESRTGTGSHCSFHNSPERALGAVHALLQQHDITEVRIVTCVGPWPSESLQPSSS